MKNPIKYVNDSGDEFYVHGLEDFLRVIYKDNWKVFCDYRESSMDMINLMDDDIHNMKGMLIGAGIAIIGLSTCVYFMNKKIKKQDEKIANLNRKVVRQETPKD